MAIVGMHHCAFAVTDLARTIEFYQKTVGMNLRSINRSKYDGLGIALFGSEWGMDKQDAQIEMAVMEFNGVEVEFVQCIDPPMIPSQPNLVVAGSAHIAFRVRDIQIEKERLEKLGVKFHSPPHTLNETGRSTWKWCFFRDPDDIIVELVEEVPIDVHLDVMADRIRAARQSRSRKLQEVAAKAGISATHLSQIERGMSVPSVATLLGISRALGVSADYFFRSDDDNGQGLATVSSTTVRGQDELTGLSELCLMLSAGESNRRTVRIQGGIEWQELTSSKGKLHLRLLRLEVGASSSDLAYQRRGRESGIVLQGTLRVELGFDTHVLEPGFTIEYDRCLPHRLVNIGNTPVLGFWATLDGDTTADTSSDPTSTSGVRTS